jgi:uncharacterized protein YbjT (DUF2867 family)
MTVPGGEAGTGMSDPSAPSAPSARRRRRVAVTGASGFVGGELVPHLAGLGFLVRALVRDPESVDPGPAVEVRPVDVSDTAALTTALAGCEVAYYLIHAMAGGEGFAQRDRELARSFAEAAARAGVSRIVYLGGMGHGELSEHLASRQEVGEVLTSTGIATVELRAAVVLGAGSISFEMVRYLTERLPMMVCPRWVNTRVQPLALGDLLSYLTEGMDVEPGVYDIGSPDVTTYREMMDAYARVRGLRRRFIIKVPVLSPALSAHWVDLVTPVDQDVSHALIESLGNEVTVRHRDRTDAAFGVRPLGSEEAIRVALENQERRLAATLFDSRQGLREGVYTDRSSARVRLSGITADGAVAGMEADLDDCGGRLTWYGWTFGWQLRIALGHLFGEDLKLGRPERVTTGATADWWTVETREPQTLVLSTRAWFCGEAWLGFRVSSTRPVRIEQVGSLRTRGLLGVAYWWLLWPIHQIAFRAMVHHRVVRARRMARRMGRRSARPLHRSSTPGPDVPAPAAWDHPVPEAI